MLLLLLKGNICRIYRTREEYFLCIQVWLALHEKILRITLITESENLVYNSTPYLRYKSYGSDMVEVGGSTEAIIPLSVKK